MRMICEMHDEAMEAVSGIQDWVNDAQNVEFEDIPAYLPEWLDFLSQQAWLIEKAVAEAKQAGIRMEHGLSAKRNKIDELESEVDDLEAQNKELASENSGLSSEIDDLKYRIADLESKVNELENRDE